MVKSLRASHLAQKNPDDEDPSDPNVTPAIIRSHQLARVDRPGFPYIDEVDSLRDEFAGFEFRLESRYQTRRAGGRTRDWVIGTISSAVDFTETEEGEEPLSTLYAELFVMPFDWLTFSSYLEYEPQGSFVRSFRNSLTWLPTELVSLGVAYSEYKFDEDADEAEEDLAIFADITISQRYKIRYQEHYDLDDSMSRLRRIAVSRDFHDWIIDVGYRESERESRERSTGTYFSLTLKTPKGLQGKIPATTVGGDNETGVRPPNS